MSGGIYFYTDPLEAAYMAKRFGMRFGCRYEDGSFNWNPGMGALHRWQEIVRWNEFAGPIFIHPDSQPLLDPVPGDLAFIDNRNGGVFWDEVRAVIPSDDEGYPYSGDGRPVMLLDCGQWDHFDRLRRIIQRGGEPFFWPESEAA